MRPRGMTEQPNFASSRN